MGKNKSGSRGISREYPAEMISSLEIFDAEGWLGTTSFFPLMDEGTPDLLISLQEKLGMGGMLVSHWLDGRYTPFESNRILIDQTAGRPDWHVVLTALPLFPEEKWFIDAAKVKAVRIYPATFGFAMGDWCAGSLCEMLLEKRMPLFVFHHEADFEDIYRLAKKYPSMNIVIESQAKKIIYSARKALALMKECANIYMETSNWYGPGLLEYMAGNIGSSRLIFGSFMPANDPLAAAGLLAYSDLPRSDRKLIAGGNIRRLISEVK